MKIKCLCLFLLFFSYLVEARESNALKICYEEWSPYAFVDDNGSYRGSVLTQFLANTARFSIPVMLFEIPHSRCVKGVKTGIYDLALFIDKNEGLTMLPKALVQWEIAVVTREGDKLTSYQDFKLPSIKRVVISRDYDYPPKMMKLLNDADKDILLVSYYAADQMDKYGLFSLIEKSQADAMLVDKIWAEEIIKQHRFGLQVNPWLFHTEPQFMGYSNLSKVKLKQAKQLLVDL